MSEQEPSQELAMRARETSSVARLRTIKAYVHHHLANGRHPRDVVNILRREWALRRKQAETYVAIALVELHKNLTDEPLESRAARIVAMINKQLTAAAERTRTVKRGGAEVEVPHPDSDTALKAIWMLAQVYGVAKPLPLEPPNGKAGG